MDNCATGIILFILRRKFVFVINKEMTNKCLQTGTKQRPRSPHYPRWSWDRSPAL